VRREGAKKRNFVLLLATTRAPPPRCRSYRHGCRWAVGPPSNMA